MSVESDAFDAATKDLRFAQKEDRLRGAFVRRRVKHLIKAHSGWNANKVATQVKAEMAAVESYLTGKAQLAAGTDTGTPPHLSLRDAANFMSGMGSFAAAMISEGEKLYKANRASWIPQIVWRATALHPVLWKTEGPPPVLQVAALDEILDRRLRPVEQMTCNVNAMNAQIFTSQRTWQVAGPNGPWVDGFEVRNFEYPNLPKAPFKSHLSSMTEWKDAGNMLVFTPPSGQAPIYFPKDIRPAWLVKRTRGGTMWVYYQPSSARKPADVIKRMFSGPRSDFLDRNWLFCDMVSSALGIEAFWHANRRRFGNDTAFDALGARTDYLTLGPVVRYDRTHDLDRLMCDDADPFFENLEVEIHDLQVGDFVCFWNSRIYDLIAEGAWRNEFSYVMGIDVDGKTGEVRVLANGPQVWVAGHGVSTVLYADMASHLITWISVALFPLYGIISSELSARPSSKEVKTPMGTTLVLWSPYEAFDRPGAWWIRIPKTIWHDEWDYPDVPAVLAAVPRTVAKEAGGTGYNPPEDDTVYFPLFEPFVAEASTDSNSWQAYLRQRKADAAFRAPGGLRMTIPDGRTTSGLYYRGANTKIPVVRPRPRI